jgi:hypothetical protein
VHSHEIPAKARFGITDMSDNKAAGYVLRRTKMSKVFGMTFTDGLRSDGDRAVWSDDFRISCENTIQGLHIKFSLVKRGEVPIYDFGYRKRRFVITGVIHGQFSFSSRKISLISLLKFTILGGQVKSVSRVGENRPTDGNQNKILLTRVRVTSRRN